MAKSSHSRKCEKHTFFYSENMLRNTAFYKCSYLFVFARYERETTDLAFIIRTYVYFIHPFYKKYKINLNRENIITTGVHISNKTKCYMYLFLFDITISILDESTSD